MTTVSTTALPGVIPVLNPANQQPVGEIHQYEKPAVLACVDRALAAQRKWAATRMSQRVRILQDFRRILCEQKDAVADVITREAGKPKSEALATEVMVILDTVGFLVDYAPMFLQPEPIPHSNPIMKLKRGWLLREPYGVIGIISPWNYPFSVPAVETLSALITGNAVVLKPSEFTPFSSLKLQEMLFAAGLEHELFQVMTGDGSTGAALLSSNLQKVVFTGSVATGKKVAQAAAARLLPVVLELGGKDPMIVLEDADIEVTSSAAVWGAFMNAGQTCLSIERCYVHERIYEPFLKACVEKTGKLRVGNGADPATDIGPLIHQPQLKIVREHVEDAIASGARLLAGGKALPELGPNFFAPTILADVTHHMRVMREETFGPVLPVRSFRNDDEAVALANASEFGLAASVWTSHRKRGEALAARVAAGTVMVNDVIACFGISEAPHGGVKNSGMGRTHGKLGLEEMVWPKYIDSDRLPRMKKLWWYGYGPQFLRQMEGFIDFLFSGKLSVRLRGGMQSTAAYLRRKIL